MLICARCGQEKYAGHTSTAPHPGNPGGTPCVGYQPQHACGNCGQDCELHDKEEPHAAPDFNCEACAPPDDYEGGGGGFGGGGASGGW